MAFYFLVLDRLTFHDEIRPALAGSWRQRSFGPCRALSAKLLPMARDFAARYHIAGEPLLSQLGDDLPFDRVLWQHLAGEMLWFSAVEIPELPNLADTLGRMLAPRTDGWSATPRPELPAILQAYHGSLDLHFGGGFYRPEHAGWNDRAAVVRLADCLGQINPDSWQGSDLAGVPDLPMDEREEELAYLRDWFGPLQTLYAQAAARDRVIVCETLE